MLFGDQRFVNELMREVSEVEKNRDIRVVFGSTIGSISRGIHRYTSDYDVRFLYVNADNNLLGRSSRHNEEKIRYRKYNKEKAYNCIAFWEASAFLTFLTEPYISNGVQYKLVRNVIWSLSSPYQLDPYGLRCKIIPLVNKAINLDCEVNHHYAILETSLRTRKTFLPIIEYFEMMHSFLSLVWIKRERSVPPLHIQTLMFSIDNMISDHINNYLLINKSKSDNSIETLKAEIPNTIYDSLTSMLKSIEPVEIDILETFKNYYYVVDSMLSIVQCELKNHQRIQLINDGVI